MKNIIVYSFILFFAGISLVSCLGDLDTMPLDDNQLVSEKVYQTKDGYTGVLAKCYASLVLTEVTPTLNAPMRAIPEMCACCFICRSCVRIIF